MESKKSIDHFVEETLQSASAIEAVKTPPFFKDKVLNKMVQSNRKEDTPQYLNWLTPTHQAAILFALIVINMVALFSMSTQDNYVESVEDFADTYGLSEQGVEEYLYLN